MKSLGTFPSRQLGGCGTGLRFRASLAFAAALLAGWTGMDAMAGPISVESGDGLALTFSNEGTVTGLAVGATPIPLHAPGGFFIADYADQPEPVNLVPNAGFEDGGSGWNLRKGQIIDRTVLHTDRAAVRIDVPGPKTASSNVGRRTPVKPPPR